MKHSIWDSFYSAYVHEIKYQIRNLEDVIRRLYVGEEQVEIISDERYEMCPLCKEITKGIRTQAKRYALIVRVTIAIQKLEDQKEQMLPGQI